MKHRTYIFIFAVLIISWSVQTIVFNGLLPANFLPIYMFMPALAALAFFMLGKNPIKKQLSLFTRKTTIWAWLFALLYPIFWFLFVIAVALLTGIGKFNASFIPQLFTWSFISTFAVSIIIALPTMFGEEYGWRGYLLPNLTKKHGKLWATIITGAVWGMWHIPSYYITYSKAGIGDPILLTIIGVITVAVGTFPYAYLFFLNGNILPCILMHAIYDLTASQILFGTIKIAGLTKGAPGLLIIKWPNALGLLIVTGGIMAVFFSRHLIRTESTKENI